MTTMPAGWGARRHYPFHVLESPVCPTGQVPSAPRWRSALERFSPAALQNELGASGTRTGTNGTPGVFSVSSFSFARGAVVSTKSMVYSLSYAAG